MGGERRQTPPTMRWRLLGRRIGDVLGFLNHLTGHSRVAVQVHNFWLLAITVVVLVAVTSADNASRQARRVARQNEQVLRDQIRGRHFAVGATCAGVSAISEAGRSIIVSSATAPETAFTRHLEELGYPPLAVRLQQAREAGRKYVQNISRAIRRVVGPGVKLVRPDGTLNCAELQVLAQTEAGNTAVRSTNR